MTRLFLDIETLPAPPDARDLWRSTLREPFATPEEEEAAFAETGLRGEFGRVFCIGYWKEPGMAAPDVLGGAEPDMLRRFWELARGVDLYVGHNILDFDLPFLVKRSIIHRVRPLALPFARYRSEPIYDTMHLWSSWGRDRVSLDTLAKALGLPTSKGTLNGSLVASAFAAGRFDEICAYCRDDVRLVRDVYRRMTFES
jgi:3'-5' exonuclease